MFLSEERSRSSEKKNEEKGAKKKTNATLDAYFLKKPNTPNTYGEREFRLFFQIVI